jgi:hypothetical protein
MRVFVFLALVIGLCLSACGAQPQPVATSDFGSAMPNQVPVHQDPPGTAPHVDLIPSEATAQMQVALVNSEVVVGQNRFAVGLLDPKGQNIRDAQVHFHYYNLIDPANPSIESEVNATRIASPDGLTVIFAVEREFNRAGNWGLEVQARFSDGTAAIKRIGFQVVADSPSLKAGQKAPSVDTPTAASVKNDLSKITSAPNPNPSFYEQPLSGALRSNRPTALLFATPSFCQTRFCGPMYDVTNLLYKQYAGKINFIHVEVFPDLPNPAATNWVTAPAMQAFNLHTEPWLFLIKRDGTIAFRVEGIFSVEEVEPHVQQLLKD